MVLAKVENHTITDLKGLLLNSIEENKELRHMIIKQQEQIGEMIPKIGDTLNNTLNLQVFLNEKCKDALNISEFINSLEIQMEDLDHTTKYGICAGVQNIFVNGLKDLASHKRPIHCTDVKREILYIKENNEWEKDDESKNKLKSAINDLAYKQRQCIKEWEINNPGWQQSDKGKEGWIHLVRAVTSSFNETTGENKIIKNIAKQSKIKC